MSEEEDAEESLTSDFIPNENNEAQDSGTLENSGSENEQEPDAMMESDFEHDDESAKEEADVGMSSSGRLASGEQEEESANEADGEEIKESKNEEADDEELPDSNPEVAKPQRDDLGVFGGGDRAGEESEPSSFISVDDQDFKVGDWSDGCDDLRSLLEREDVTRPGDPELHSNEAEEVVEPETAERDRGSQEDDTPESSPHTHTLSSQKEEPTPPGDAANNQSEDQLQTDVTPADARSDPPANENEVDPTPSEPPRPHEEDSTSGLMLITEVQHAVHAPRAPRKTARTFAYPHRDEESYSNDELSRLFDALLETKTLRDRSAMRPLRRWIRGELLKAVSESRYLYCQKLQTGQGLLDRLLKSDDGELAQAEKRRQMAEHCSVVKEELNAAKRQWSDRIARCKELQDRRIAELEATHRRQIKEFERQWADPNFLMVFTKPSPRLNFLRNSERTLAIFQEFERARCVKAEADMLAKCEEMGAEQRAIVAMKTEFQTLETRQKQEMDCLVEYLKQRLDGLEQKRRMALLPMEQVVRRLSGTSQPPKLGRKKKKEVVGDDRGHWPRPGRANRELEPKPIAALELPGIRVRKYVKVTSDSRKTKDPLRKKRVQGP
jgi:hypothetical protein